MSRPEADFPATLASMKMIWVLLALLGFLHFTQPAHSLSPLQILIDVTPTGGSLKPLPGTYSGPLVIKHPNYP